MKKIFLLVLVIFLITFPLVSSYDYSDEVYGCGLYGEGCSSESSISPPAPASPSGGGGGTSCTYDWDCTNWFPEECPASGIQERIGINRGTCTGTQGQPPLTKNCSYEHKEPLFDIFLTLEKDYKEICSGDKIKAKVRLENFGKIELLDAFMTYWVVDENNKLITEVKDTRAVSQDKDIEVDLEIPQLTCEGTYRVYAEITYDNNKTALAGESFKILSEQECEILAKKKFNWLYLIIAIAILLIIILLIIIINLIKNKIKYFKKCKKTTKQKTHRDYKRKVKSRLKNIRAKNYLFVIFTLATLTSIFVLGTSITGLAVSEQGNLNTDLLILGIILLVSLVSTSIYIYKKEFLKHLRERLHSYPNDSIKGLINKKIYTLGGEYIGEIEEVYLRNNLIDSLKVKLAKKYQPKGVIISYKNVEAVKKIVLINNNILEKIQKYDKD